MAIFPAVLFTSLPVGKDHDAWHYLTGSGAITAAGLVGGIEVDLGSGHMSRYQLPHH